jgi:hypothetical protein
MSMLAKPWRLLGFAAGGTVGAAAVRDYTRWRSLGEGGVPANAIGYVIVSLLRLLKREPLSTKPYDAMKSDPYNQSWISALPTRHGTRPSIDPHLIPQQQVDQHGANDVMAQTQKLFDRTVAAQVLSAGWGERHALAGLARLPLTYLMVYAPRDDNEVAVIGRLLRLNVIHEPNRALRRQRSDLATGQP